MAATGIASSLGKTLSGSSSVRTIVESFGDTMPSTFLVCPAA
jgi:hypothetical protein